MSETCWICETADLEHKMGHIRVKAPQAPDWGEVDLCPLHYGAIRDILNRQIGQLKQTVKNEKIFAEAKANPGQ